MDYAILHGVNAFVVLHPLLASAVRLLATWIVPLVVAATIIPWLASGRGVDARKHATAGALGAAALALAANQLIAHLWDRPRPYAAHAAIVPFAGISSDPSFPSDHVAAAFAIAVAAMFASRRAGRVLLVLAAITAASRLLGAAHYPSDVLGGAVIGAASGLVVARLEALWLPIVHGGRNGPGSHTDDGSHVGRALDRRREAPRPRGAPPRRRDRRMHGVRDRRPSARRDAARAPRRVGRGCHLARPGSRPSG